MDGNEVNWIGKFFGHGPLMGLAYIIIIITTTRRQRIA